MIYLTCMFQLMSSVSAARIALRMPRGRYVITLADVPEGRAQRCSHTRTDRVI